LKNIAYNFIWPRDQRGCGKNASLNFVVTQSVSFFTQVSHIEVASLHIIFIYKFNALIKYFVPEQFCSVSLPLDDLSTCLFFANDRCSRPVSCQVEGWLQEFSLFYL